MSLIPNVLKKPVRRYLVAQVSFLCEFVHTTSNGIELCALQIAPLGISNLLSRRTSWFFTRQQIGERHHAIGQLHTARAFALRARTCCLAWPRLPGKVFVIEQEVGPADRRRSTTEAELHIDALETGGIR